MKLFNFILVEHRNSNELLSPGAELPGFGVQSSSQNSEASDCRTVCSDGYSESDGTSVIVDGGMLEPSPQLSASDCLPVQGNDLLSTCVVGGSRTPTSYCQNDGDKAPFVTSNYNYPLCSYIANHVMHDGKSLVNYHLNHEDDQLGFSGLDVQSESKLCSWDFNLLFLFCFHFTRALYIIEVTRS